MLAVSGRLDLTAVGGPTYPADREYDYGFVGAGRRRSVYEPVFRNALPEIFQAFDFADPSSVVGRRSTSTVAPQALFLLNNPFTLEQSKAAAEKLLADTAGKAVSARLGVACRSTLGREPTAGESTALIAFLAERSDNVDAWSHVFHALFGSTDFRYVD
jgi:hypothetical protein